MSKRIVKRTYLVHGIIPKAEYVLLDELMHSELSNKSYQMCIWRHLALRSDINRMITRSTGAISTEMGIKEKDVKRAIKALINKGYLSVVNE